MRNYTILKAWIIINNSRFSYLHDYKKCGVMAPGSKSEIPPTKYKYQATKIPAILDFNHRCSNLEMTVDCVDGFIYPYRICKTAIFVFLSIYQNSFNILFLTINKIQFFLILLCSWVYKQLNFSLLLAEQISHPVKATYSLSAALIFLQQLFINSISAQNYQKSSSVI